MSELSTEDRQWKFIANMFSRLDTIENNHLAHMQDDIGKLDQKLFAILMVVFAQLFAIVGGLVMYMLA